MWQKFVANQVKFCVIFFVLFEDCLLSFDDNKNGTAQKRDSAVLLKTLKRFLSV
jgi:hypothetical protein